MYIAAVCFPNYVGRFVALFAVPHLLAAVMFFMFAWNVYIAWILITEVSETG